MATMPFINKVIYRNTALTNSTVLIRSGRTNIFGFVITSANAATSFIQLFDAADISSVTLGTTAPTEVVQVGANAQVLFELETFPWRQFTNGLVVAATTTATGSTAPVSAVNVTVSYS